MQTSLDHFESALQFMIGYPEKSTFELISDWTERQLGISSAAIDHDKPGSKGAGWDGKGREFVAQKEV